MVPAFAFPVTFPIAEIEPTDTCVVETGIPCTLAVVTSRPITRLAVYRITLAVIHRRNPIAHGLSHPPTVDESSHRHRHPDRHKPEFDVERPQHEQKTRNLGCVVQTSGETHQTRARLVKDIKDLLRTDSGKRPACKDSSLVEFLTDFFRYNLDLPVGPGLKRHGPVCVDPYHRVDRFPDTHTSHASRPTSDGQL